MEQPPREADTRQARNLQRGLSASASARDIRVPREVYDDERREAAQESLRAFLDSYFQAAFPLPWSQDHLDVIEILQRVATVGGLFALAMPRGSGKTTLSVRAAMWALLTGRRKYVEVIASTERAAQKIIKAIKSEVSYNKQLILDWPNELHGLWQLQGDNRKAGGQLCGGEKTGVSLGVSEIIFPTHQYTPIGGSIVYAAGLTGNVRGPNHTRMDGSVIRPDLIILDDPQTRESATSGVQTQDRVEIVEGDVLGLAGPGQTIAAVMPCTVIAREDLAERFLSNSRWTAKRSKLLYSFPSDMALWDRYYETRAEGLRVDHSPDAGDEFLRQNWDALHAGSKVGWEHRKQEGELSALQSAMHLYYQSPTAFAAEYQNEPLDQRVATGAPTLAGLADKVTALPRGMCPVWATHLTMGIDVQQRCLYYVVVAWGAGFAGSVVDYGAFPQQSRTYFTAADASPTLQEVSGMQLEGSLRWGLDQLTMQKCGRQWAVENGNQLPVSRAVIDANWGQSTDTVYEFCRRTPYAGVVLPSHGRGLKAGDRPMTEYKQAQGEVIGFHWLLKSGDNKRGIRHLLPDVNFWKTFLAQRVAAGAGEPGSLSVFGDRPEQHRMLQDHITAEYCEHTTGRGREVWEWRSKPNAENHWLDCLVLAATGASTLGVQLASLPPVQPQKRRTFSIPGR